MTGVEDVPAELIVAYDHIYGKEVMAFPPSAVDGLRERFAVFFSSFYGGFWVLTRYEDIRKAFQDSIRFVQHAGGLPLNPYSRIHIPLMLDPPEHTKYRKLLTPVFAPRMIAKLETIIRDIARKQLAKIASARACEFVDDFCMVLPAAMYCGMLGIDPINFPAFNKLSVDLIFGAAAVLASDGEQAAKEFRSRTSKAIDDLMIGLIKERRSQRGEDLISILLDAEMDGRALTDDEILNMASLIFFAGTDSTASMISYSFMFLAQHPEHRQQIIDEPSIIPDAVTELIRFHGFHHIRREVAADTEFAGVTMKKGDILVLPVGGGNHDPEKFENPLEIDFRRTNSGGNLSFGAGPHRCIGQHLAMIQLRIALEEVHRFIKDYRLDPEQKPEYMTSQAKTVLRRLPLLYRPVLA